MKRIIITLLSLILLMNLIVCVNAEDAETSAGVDTESPLYGKSVLFVGDSVCEGWCEWDDPVYKNTIAWAGRIMTKNGMTGDNKSLGGASISDCREDNTVINQLKKVTANTYDLVIIQGGVNDAWDSCPVGRMVSGFDGPFNTATFAGGLEETIKFAKENFPDAIIAFTITFSMPKAPYGYISNMGGYVNMTKKICDKWEVPYLDLYNDEDFNKNQLKTDTTECLSDYIHPNSAGYNVLAPVIEEWMKTLVTEPQTPEESVDESVEESIILESEPTADESTPSATVLNYSMIALIASLAVVLIVAAVVVVVVIVVTKKNK